MVFGVVVGVSDRVSDMRGRVIDIRGVCGGVAVVVVTFGVVGLCNVLVGVCWFCSRCRC